MGGRCGREIRGETSGGGSVGGRCGREVWKGDTGRDVGWGRCGREIRGETSGGGGVEGRCRERRRVGEVWEGGFGGRYRKRR